MQLHELVAVEADRRKTTQKRKTELYHKLQKQAAYFGRRREYRPLDDDGAQLPPEHQKIQRDLRADLYAIKEAVITRIDLAATRDLSNQYANADIEIDGNTIATNVPVTTLLWLEKELHDIRSELREIPTLPLDASWTFDEGSQHYVTPEVKTMRTQKTEEPLVIVPATDKHPAQAKTVTVDRVVGEWVQQRTSSAMPEHEKEELLDRLDQLYHAVVAARTRANQTEVKNLEFGAALFDYLGF